MKNFKKPIFFFFLTFFFIANNTVTLRAQLGIGDYYTVAINGPREVYAHGPLSNLGTAYYEVYGLPTGTEIDVIINDNVDYAWRAVVADDGWARVTVYSVLFRYGQSNGLRFVPRGLPPDRMPKYGYIVYVTRLN